MNVSPSSTMNGRRILLGVSGGIAAYKIPELVRLFKKAGCPRQGGYDARRLAFCDASDTRDAQRK